jgi:hypothetical protein
VLFWRSEMIKGGERAERDAVRDIELVEQNLKALAPGRCALQGGPARLLKRFCAHRPPRLFMTVDTQGPRPSTRLHALRQAAGLPLLLSPPARCGVAWWRGVPAGGGASPPARLCPLRTCWGDASPDPHLASCWVFVCCWFAWIPKRAVSGALSRLVGLPTAATKRRRC